MLRALLITALILAILGQSMGNKSKKYISCFKDCEANFHSDCAMKDRMNNPASCLDIKRRCQDQCEPYETKVEEGSAEGKNLRSDDLINKRELDELKLLIGYGN